MVIADFRAAFPEFASVTDYPDAMITFWATIAEKQVVLDVWTDMWPFGVQLYVAHELALARGNAIAGGSGGVSGGGGGLTASKAVGSVSVSYDTTSTSLLNGGWWNSTNYGRQFLTLARMFGAGCIQL